MSSMIVRGIDFGRVLNSSGARGFFGEGYWFHRLFPGLDYRGSTFVAKTTTLEARAGNMPLRGDYTPAEVSPKCIVVKPWKGVVLNSVGLSGPGIAPLLRRWSGYHGFPDSPGGKMISVMSVLPDSKDRADEMRKIADAVHASDLPRDVGVQLNLSCPNVGLNPSYLVQDAQAQLDALRPLGRPIFLKVNVLFPVEAALELSKQPGCDGFVVSNTIPWGKLPERIDWRRLFGSDVSPLASIGGGGLSGKPLLPLVTEWVRSARAAGVHHFAKIVGGGGILSVRDAAEMVSSGVDAIELGSISILRPWRVASVIRYANDMIPRSMPLRALT